MGLKATQDITFLKIDSAAPLDAEIKCFPPHHFLSMSGKDPHARLLCISLHKNHKAGEKMANIFLKWERSTISPTASIMGESMETEQDLTED